MAAVGFIASRREKQSDDYFPAGRNLTWWIIGGSMIAANILIYLPLFTVRSEGQP